MHFIKFDKYYTTNNVKCKVKNLKNMGIFRRWSLVSRRKSAVYFNRLTVGRGSFGFGPLDKLPLWGQAGQAGQVSIIDYWIEIATSLRSSQ